MSKKVDSMFSEIAKKYDLMNDVLSLGIHRIWKKKLINLLNLNENSKVIDLATGTGDLVFEINKKTKNVIGTDFNEDMLNIAREKAKRNNINLVFEKADAMNLKYNDNEFDFATISFGVRNIDDVPKSINEMARVIKPNGKLAIMEFGQPKGIIGALYKQYSKYIIPLLGKIIVGDSKSYTYLPVTAARFPAGDSFVKIMNDTNKFSNITKYKLSFGISYIYIGIVK